MQLKEQITLLEKRIEVMQKRINRLEQAQPAKPKRKSNYEPILKGRIRPGMERHEIQSLIHERHLRKAAKKKAA